MYPNVTTTCETIPSIESPINSLKFLSHNISSIPLHLDFLVNQCLDHFGVEFDAICFCETHPTDSVALMYDLPHYNAFFINNYTYGGELAIYLHSKFSGSKLHNLSLRSLHTESLFIKVSKPLKFILGTVYRPPNANVHYFLLCIGSSLEYFVNEKLTCYLMGD